MSFSFVVMVGDGVFPSIMLCSEKENKPVSPGMPELLAHFLLPFGTPAMLEQLEGMVVKPFGKKCSKLACLAYFVTGQDPGQQIADYVILIWCVRFNLNFSSLISWLPHISRYFPFSEHSIMDGWRYVGAKK
jgi:hypothetical protein